MKRVIAGKAYDTNTATTIQPEKRSSIMTTRIDRLDDLVGQESGIVIYDTVAIICNWSASTGEPKISTHGDIIELPTKIKKTKGRRLKASEVVSLLDGIEIIYDVNGDESALRNGEYSARRFQLDGAIVLAPDGWS